MRRYVKDLHSAYEQQGKAALISPPQGKQIQLFAAHLLNRTGSATDMGVLIKRAATDWNLGLVSDAATPDLSDVTAAIQANVTQDLFTTTVGDGFLVQSENPFNLIGLTVSQAEAGAPVYTYEYFNGTSYVPLTLINAPSFASTGDVLVVFASPRDWVPGSTGTVGGSAGLYSVRIRATTAPGQAVQVSAAWVAAFLHFQSEVANNGTMSVVFPYEHPRLLESGEGLLPYFEVASPNNCVTAIYFNQD